MSERLTDIKQIQTYAELVHQSGDPQMELHDVVMRFWEQGHTDWLIEQAEMFESLAEHHDEALADNKRLREENYRLRITYENTGTMMDRAVLRAENRKLREILQEISKTPITRGISPVEIQLQQVVELAKKALGDSK